MQTVKYASQFPIIGQYLTTLKAGAGLSARYQ